MLHKISVADGGWQTMAENQKPSYRPTYGAVAPPSFTKLAMAESQKPATDIRHSTAMADI
ncbi:hypothetical protein A2U01_0036264 [Trifolium medium]|uniref:Uncharacterized protein n=1 Tax=Trifolium medium TaxID=97028 RepID=A0A392PUE5_9FABA|nr:hypothetical protein [Trifolium medium]